VAAARALSAGRAWRRSESQRAMAAVGSPFSSRYQSCFARPISAGIDPCVCVCVRVTKLRTRVTAGWLLPRRRPRSRERCGEGKARRRRCCRGEGRSAGPRAC
jgi:hypothetical protein